MTYFSSCEGNEMHAFFIYTQHLQPEITSIILAKLTNISIFHKKRLNKKKLLEKNGRLLQAWQGMMPTMHTPP